MGGCWDSGWRWHRGSGRQMLETIIAWAIRIFETSPLVGLALLPYLLSTGAQLLLVGTLLLLVRSPIVLDSNCYSLENVPFGFWELDVEDPSRSRAQPLLSSVSLCLFVAQTCPSVIVDLWIKCPLLACWERLVMYSSFFCNIEAYEKRETN